MNAKRSKPTKTECALDFVERCGGGESLAELVDAFQQTIAVFGFSASTCAAWAGVGTQRVARLYFVNGPQDWLDLYMAHGWLEGDVLVSEAAARMSPFGWQDVREERALSEAEAEICQAARHYGWADSFAVPIHGPAGYQAIVTMTAKAPAVLSATDRALLQTTALAMHERCRSSHQSASPDAAAPKLTKREIECLRWVATGKTDWEISQLLGIAAPTVHFHVERAKKKLDATTRAQAVALLTLHGIS